MIRNSIIGYPRVGSQRELKFWTEDYFQGIISAETLQTNSLALRKEQWLLQQHHAIDFIPSNDFSFYDGVLDTAYLLNVIPQTYKNLGLNELDTYFAMARGYQGPEGDVKALAMRKWFNTNYHYIVPLIDDDTEIKLNSDKPFAQYRQALALGVQTKPVLVGPFTFLKLADYRGACNAQNMAVSIARAYIQIFNNFNNLGAEWLQLDEPYLVTDLDERDIALFMYIYSELMVHRGSLKILLQSYFGDMRDIYPQLIKLGFDGIGLDFIEGQKSLEIIHRYGFSKETLLFAGVLNGKNIWRNNYARTLEVLKQLTSQVEKERIVISSSCSFLHVPYSLENETQMDEQHKAHFAFAQEKLAELADLKEFFADGVYDKKEKYKKNQALIESQNACADLEIQARIANLSEKDFQRRPAFVERERLQKEALHLPILPTTTIGSFPQTAEIKALRSQLRNNKLSSKQYQGRIKEKIAQCIARQEEIGLDVLVHGEFERNDMVEHFGQNLSGFLFTEKAWVQSYGTRCVKPPIIWSDIKRSQAITLDYSIYAQSITDKPVKGMLTGPITILNWSFPREDISRREMALQIALAIKEEVMDLEANGIKIIQIDEAALKEKLPLRREDWHNNYLAWAIPAFRLVHAGVQPETQIHTHMCYSEFEGILPDIEAMDADVISFEASRSHLAIVDALQQADFKTEVGPGVYDIHSPRVPGQEEISRAISTMLKKIPAEKLWINPDCGLKTRGESETFKSLKNMVAAAQEIRERI